MITKIKHFVSLYWVPAVVGAQVGFDVSVMMHWV
jgi:hypothetical protein